MTVFKQHCRRISVIGLSQNERCDGVPEMPEDDRIEQFTERAASCERAAENVRDDELRWVLLDAARQWRELVKQIRMLHEHAL
jgi:hypothetical protein